MERDECALEKELNLIQGLCQFISLFLGKGPQRTESLLPHPTTRRKPQVPSHWELCSMGLWGAETCRVKWIPRFQRHPLQKAPLTPPAANFFPSKMTFHLLQCPSHWCLIYWVYCQNTSFLRPGLICTGTRTVAWTQSKHAAISGYGSTP